MVAPHKGQGGTNAMKDFFAKTFTELTTEEPLEIHGLGETPLADGKAPANH